MHTHKTTRSHLYTHIQHTTRGRAQLTHCQNVLKFRGPLAWQLQAGDNIWSRRWNPPPPHPPKKYSHHRHPSSNSLQPAHCHCLIPSFFVQNMLSPTRAKTKPAHPNGQQLTLFLNNLVTAVLPSRRGNKNCYTHWPKMLPAIMFPVSKITLQWCWRPVSLCEQSIC